MGNEKIIWDKLISVIGNAYGVAGLMGNLYAESGLLSNNLQNSYERSLGFTDDQYVRAVDNGTYTNFIKDQAGFGLAQWTYWSRKKNLLEYAQNHNKSIGNLEMQVDFLCEEIRGYSKVFSALKSAKSVKEASDIVVTDYENPADQSTSVKNKRAEFGQKYYDKYATDGSLSSYVAKTSTKSMTNTKTPLSSSTGSTAQSGWYKVKTTASSLNIREGAGTSYMVLGALNKGHIVTIRATKNGWGKVVCYADTSPQKVTTGWIYLGYTEKL